MNELEKREYLSRFPKNFKDYLSEKNHLNRFLSNVDFDFVERVVYRGVHDRNELTQEDFMNNIDSSRYYELETKPERTLENFGVSVNEEIKALELQMRFPNKRLKLVAIARGMMNCELGPATIDEDRPHHNWFLYDGNSNNLVTAFEIVKTYE